MAHQLVEEREQQMRLVAQTLLDRAALGLEPLELAPIPAAACGESARIGNR